VKTRLSLTAHCSAVALEQDKTLCSKDGLQGHKEWLVGVKTPGCPFTHCSGW